MKKYILGVLIIIATFSCTTKNNKFIVPSESDRLLDSIKKRFDIKDSIKLIYNDTSSFTVFIDYNKKSEYHTEQKERFKDWYYDSTSYYSQVNEQKEARQSINRITIPDSLIGRLIPVYSIESNFYAYYDCDYQHVFEINDSTFNWYSMDPVVPYVIDSLLFFENGFELKSVSNNSMKFTKINNKPLIYKLKFDDWCIYVTSIENINEFPILVVFCSSQGLSPLYNEVKFDEIDCN